MAKFGSKRIFWNEFMNVDMRSAVPTLAIAADFIHGRYDCTANYGLARDYFGRLEAPVKGFYTFEDSAHGPAFEEPEKMLRVMREDVRGGGVGLADVR